MSPLIYFDHHATTPLDPRVFEAMRPWYTEHTGNAASLSHQAGRRAAVAVAESRASIAQSLGCEPDEILFTCGATEANNLAIKGVLAAAGREAHVITNQAEHRAVLDPVRRWHRTGSPVTIVGVDRDGRVPPESIREALTPHTRLVTVMAANNEVGTINALDDVASMVLGCGALLHSDAAQAVGRIPVDLRTLPVDLLSLTAHKLYGPQGIGALFVRRGRGRIPIEPLLDGGGHERGLRSGTLPVALIVGFATAVQLAVSRLSTETDTLSSLRERLWRGLRDRISGVELNGHPTRRLAGNLNVTIPGVDGDALLVRLQQTNLAVSSGAACSSANPEPSHVLRAMGRCDREARSSLRFGLGHDNTAAEVDSAVTIVAEVVHELRATAT
ncbi:MAG: cysteine desulfurase family protein [Planctomycetaceae bacterium]